MGKLLLGTPNISNVYFFLKTWKTTQERKSLETKKLRASAVQGIKLPIFICCHDIQTAGTSCEYFSVWAVCMC